MRSALHKFATVTAIIAWNISKIPQIVCFSPLQLFELTPDASRLKGPKELQPIFTYTCTQKRGIARDKPQIRTGRTSIQMNSSMNSNNNDSTRNVNINDDNESPKQKRVILVRHACTHMNEYLAKPGSEWGATKFTDIFNEDDIHSYQDSPLSPRGTQQARELYEYFRSSEEGKGIIRDMELVAVSPLRRTLQTAEIGILPHLRSNDDSDADGEGIPFVALPLASERVYLISDIGKPTADLKEMFPFADFEKEFDKFNKNEWWFAVKDKDVQEMNESTSITHESVSAKVPLHPFNFMYREDYVEWRPNDGDQKYASLGEPDDAFQGRMVALYNWIEAREEKVICVVAHWGVLDWLVGDEFDNCQVKDVLFKDIQLHVNSQRLK